MKVKCVTIEVKTLRESLKEALNVMHAIQRGRPPKRKREGLYFVDVEAMRKVLTPKRLDLLRSIKERPPRSIYELARRAGRDLKNVQADVGLLSRLGLISLSRVTKARRRVILRVDYDQLQLRIPMTRAR